MPNVGLKNNFNIYQKYNMHKITIQLYLLKYISVSNLKEIGHKFEMNLNANYINNLLKKVKNPTFQWSNHFIKVIIPNLSNHIIFPKVLTMQPRQQSTSQFHITTSPRVPVISKYRFSSSRNMSVTLHSIQTLWRSLAAHKHDK